MEENGPSSLFNQLLNIHIENKIQPSFLKPTHTDRDRTRRKLRKVLYDAVFKTQRGPHGGDKKQNTDEYQLTECEHVISTAFEFRCERRFDEAAKMEELIANLSNDTDTDASTIRNVMKFLVCLKNTGPKPRKSYIGHKELMLQREPGSFEETGLLPRGPLYYGDSTHKRENEQYYMHYPDSIFKQEAVVSDGKQMSAYQNTNLQLFLVDPAVCTTGSGHFHARGILNDDHERKTRHTLFGALTHSRTTNIDIKIDLPEIEEKIPEIRIPTLLENIDDEGFVDTSMAGSCVASPEDDASVDVWDAAIHHQPSNHYTWERHGRHAGRTERPYISEAGPQAFDELHDHMQRQLLMIDTRLQIPPRNLIFQWRLLQEIMHLLIAVPSHTFSLDQVHQEFKMKAGTYMTGTSPESLHSLCHDYIECGTNYYRLTRFSTPPKVDSFYRSGLVFQAFTDAIRKYLQHYRACVLSINIQNSTVLQLKMQFNKIIRQIRYMAQLCYCCNANNEEFPTGVRLLSYLYKEAMDATCTENYSVLLSLLRTSCGPYIMFIQDWVFYGVCRDIYREFLIDENSAYLQFRDKHYWTHGYVMIRPEVTDSVPLFMGDMSSVPLFMGDMSSDIYTCGKSINLLRLICPEHFICKLDIPIPRLTITFSDDELKTIAQRSQMYVARIEHLASQKLLTRHQLLEDARKAKLDLMQKAKNAAAAELDRLQDRIIELRKTDDARKRKVFDELKEQMEKDLQRRAMIIDKDKKEDRELVENLSKREILQTEYDRDLEKRAREELVEYYEKLSEDAAHREQKALWKVQRQKLNEARTNFLLQDDAYWEAQLAAVKQKEEETTVVEVTAPEVTNLMDMSLHLAVPPSEMAGSRHQNIHTSHDPNTSNLLNLTIPATHGTLAKTNNGKADDTLAKTNVMDMSISALPSWAKHTADDTVIVQDDDDTAVQPAQKRDNIAAVQPPQKSDNIAAAVQSPQKIDNIAAIQKVKSSEKTVTETNKSHPSDSSAGNLLYPLTQTELDLPNWARDKVPPVDVNIDDMSENGLSSSVKGKYLAAKDPLGGGDAGEITPSEDKSTTDDKVYAKPHPSDSKITDLLYPPTAAADNTSGKSSIDESQPLQSVKKSTKIYGHSSQESVTCYEINVPKLRRPEDIFASLESDQSSFYIAPRRKKLDGEFAARESQETPPRHQIKMFIDRHASHESQHLDLAEITAQKTKKHHVTEESNQNAQNTEATRLVKFQNQNVHGHASQETEDLDLDELAALKAHKRKLDSHVTEESPKADDKLAQLMKFQKRNIHGHVSQQTEAVDEDAIRLQKFRHRNLAGHASDSTVQRLVYGKAFGKDIEEVDENGQEDDEWEKYAEVVLENYKPVPYRDNFNVLDDAPVVDLMSNIPRDVDDYDLSTTEDIKSHEYTSLSVLLKQSVMAPLQAQISLVNRSLLNYFLMDLNVELHFKVLRRFLFMEDGEFAQALSDQLFDKLASNPLPHEMLNPVFLNMALAKALTSSLYGDLPEAKNISFSLRYMPQVFMQNASDSLDCLELHYKVDWPINIVITENSLTKYCKVFSFLLQLKRVVWVLKDIFHRLKTSAVTHKGSRSPQLHQLQLYRHEMQHFVKVLQGYVANQVIHVTWLELEESLTNNVNSLDELRARHHDYINAAIFRSLLSTKAGPVMKIIKDIFCLILKFRSLLLISPWKQDHVTGHMKLDGFEKMVQYFKSFKEYSRFLFKVVRKLSTRGYQPHLQELLVRLNFNDFYEERD